MPSRNADPAAGPLHLIWRTYRPNWYRKEPPRCHRAILTRRVVGESGKPVLQEVGYVSAYDETRLADPKMQREFWQRARFQLGRLRLKQNEIALIEQSLSLRVPYVGPDGIPRQMTPSAPRTAAR
jgi:hypothetical protein